MKIVAEFDAPAHVGMNRGCKINLSSQDFDILSFSLQETVGSSGRRLEKVSSQFASIRNLGQNTAWNHRVAN